MDRLRDRGRRERLNRWRDWVKRADQGRLGAKLKDWADPADSEYLVAVDTAEGETLIRPGAVAGAFATEWGELWKPGEDVEGLDALCRGLAAGPAELPPSRGRTSCRL